MPPRKAKQRSPHPHSHPIPPPSDLESEPPALNLLDVLPGPSAPNPLRTNAQLNFAVIKRHEPLLASVLAVAPYAVVYAFSPLTQHWEKSGVEGTLFVCKLLPLPSGADRYSVIVLNRRGLNNFHLELFGPEDVEATDEYLILQDRAEPGREVAVFGLWVFAEPEPASTAGMRERIAGVVAECAANAEASRVAVGESSAEGAHGGLASSPIRFSSTAQQELDGESVVSASLPPQPSSFPNPPFQHPPPPTSSGPPGVDIIGELFRKASLNHRAS